MSTVGGEGLQGLYGATPLMTDAGGLIINMTSRITRRPAARASYAASKAALDCLSRAMARELQDNHSDIKVLAVCPGLIATQMDRDRKAVKLPWHAATAITRLINTQPVSGLYHGEELIEEFK